MTLYTPKRGTKFSAFLCKRFDNQNFEYSLPFVATIAYRLHYNRCASREDGDILYSAWDYLKELMNVKDQMYSGYYNIMIRIKPTKWEEK